MNQTQAQTTRTSPDKISLRMELLGDLMMILLVVINLSLIVFDWFFSITPVNALIAHSAPEFHEIYALSIHANFFYYDLIFVAIFFSEFLLSWAVAIKRKTFERWFFYPLVHWYDLLGCIPVDALRWLRLLRVLSLLYRLQRSGIIDLSNTEAWKFVMKYYKVLVEEISDRIVINVLEGVQEQVREGNPLVHRIQSEVLQPRTKQLADYIAVRIITVTEKTHERYRDDLGIYLTRFTDDALAKSRSGSALASMPLIGPRVVALLGETVRELGTSLVDQLIIDITRPENRDKLDDVLLALFEDAAIEPAQISQLVSETLLDILEQVKAQVAEKQWRAELAEDKSDNLPEN